MNFSVVLGVGLGDCPAASWAFAVLKKAYFKIYFCSLYWGGGQRNLLLL